MCKFVNLLSDITELLLGFLFFLFPYNYLNWLGELYCVFRYRGTENEEGGRISNGSKWREGSKVIIFFSNHSWDWFKSLKKTFTCELFTIQLKIRFVRINDFLQSEKSGLYELMIFCSQKHCSALKGLWAFMSSVHVHRICTETLHCCFVEFSVINLHCVLQMPRAPYRRQITSCISKRAFLWSMNYFHTWFCSFICMCIL